MLGDNKHTLTPSCHEKIENEANFAAARLLFLRDRFSDEAKDLPPNMNSLKILAKTFGNTNTSTLWRCIEVWGNDCPILGLVTAHPVPRYRKLDFNADNPCRHFIQSPNFASQFSSVKETTVFDQIVTYCSGGKGGPLGSADIQLSDDNGDHHIFEFESFSFYHYTLTLGIYKCPKPTIVFV